MRKTEVENRDISFGKLFEAWNPLLVFLRVAVGTEYCGFDSPGFPLAVSQLEASLRPDRSEVCR